MPRTICCAATTLDGVIADPAEAFDWLLSRAPEEEFFAGIGAIVTDAQTFDRLAQRGPWPAVAPMWVLTDRNLHGNDSTADAQAPDVRFVRGSVADHYFEICTATGDHDLWVLGGGELVGAFADQGILDEVITLTVPVAHGTGRSVLPRSLELELIEAGQSDSCVLARHRVLGPLRQDA